MKYLIIAFLLVVGLAVGMPNDGYFPTEDGIIQLSGVSAKVFDLPMFQNVAPLDILGSIYTPSMAAFLKDNEADGKPLSQSKTPLRAGAL